MERSSSSLIKGVGVSARPQYFDELLRSQRFPWLEVLADNYLHKGSVSQNRLFDLSEMYPLVFHCVGMSLGSSKNFDWSYMKKLKGLIKRVKPHWISDHLCFSSFGGFHYHDLIPVPYTSSTVEHFIKKLHIVEDFFEIPFLLENVSIYMTYSVNEMDEVEFINRILDQTKIGLLLDVNNIYVNSFNWGRDAYQFIDQIDFSRVKQIHLAGFRDMGAYLLDTHSHPIHDLVFRLYRYILRKSVESMPVCLEWDEDLPSFDVFKREHKKIQEVFSEPRDGLHSTSLR